MTGSSVVSLIVNKDDLVNTDFEEFAEKIYLLENDNGEVVLENVAAEYGDELQDVIVMAERAWNEVYFFFFFGVSCEDFCFGPIF